MPSAACLPIEGIQREQRPRAPRGCPSRESRKVSRSQRGSTRFPCKKRAAISIRPLRRSWMGSGTPLIPNPTWLGCLTFMSTSHD
jgi:hypothetical protein